MELHHPTAEIFVPDGRPAKEAMGRVTRLGIGAHQDDLEFMAFHGILACHGSLQEGFGGVVCTNGAGSARTGPYAACGDAEMAIIRRREQRDAARIGRYAALLQLDHASRALAESGGQALEDDLFLILAATQPAMVYTHNPADKHPTHVRVAMATLRAIRRMPAASRPRHVWGCEVWRDLDWLPDDKKVVMDVSGGRALADALHAAFASQIAGGKRYDLAVTGRRAANATFLNSHATDSATQVILGIDLSPLAADGAPDPADYVCGLIDDFKREVWMALAPASSRHAPPP